MILPIVGYGAPVLKKKAEAIGSDYPDLQAVVENMFHTMDNAEGVGLAAPQVGLPIRIFVVDGSPFADIKGLNEEEKTFLESFRRAFINPKVIEESGEDWAFEEGCLSIPGIHEKVFRPSDIIVEYCDENFEIHREAFSGYAARIIQHEYDHLEGVVFTDHLSALGKRMVQKRLANISMGITDTHYPMRRPALSRKIK